MFGTKRNSWKLVNAYLWIAAGLTVLLVTDSTLAQVRATATATARFTVNRGLKIGDQALPALAGDNLLDLTAETAAKSLQGAVESMTPQETLKNKANQAFTLKDGDDEFAELSNDDRSAEPVLRSIAEPQVLTMTEGGAAVLPTIHFGGQQVSSVKSTGGTTKSGTSVIIVFASY